MLNYFFEVYSFRKNNYWKKYEKIKVDSIISNQWFKKIKESKCLNKCVYNIIFKFFNYSFRFKFSVYGMLRVIKEWKKNTVWFIDYDVRKVFDKVNKKCLKYIFLSYINDVWLL